MSTANRLAQLLACVAGVWKERERGFWARGKREGRARRKRGRETPARKPLFSPFRLLIMHAKITQLWMTSCQISLAAMRLFKSYFAYCFSFVFLKQEISSEGTIKKSVNGSSVERRKSQPCVACYIKSSINLLRFCWRYRVGLPNLHAVFVGDINHKHFADSRTGSSAAYKRTLVAGKEERNFKDLQ